MEKTKHRRGRSPVAFLLSLILAIGAPVLVGGLAPTAAAADDTNIAVTATTNASFTPTWNSLAAINDGNNNPTGHAQMWGSWDGTRPAQQWVSYSWDEPVSIAKSVVYFWRDAAVAGTGDNVWVPQSWKLQYKSATVADWTDIPGASAYTTDAPAAVAGTIARPTQVPNTVTFPKIQVTEVRALLNAFPGTTSGFSAMAIPEWEVWGVADSGPPPSSNDPISVDEIHLPTAVGTVPTLPATAWLTFVDGVRAERAVTWTPITAAQVAAVGSFLVSGTAEGVGPAISATVHVRAVGATPALTGFLPQSALTVAGSAPQLPATALGLYADGSVDSRLAVTWDAIAAAEYAEPGILSVLGTVAGTTLRPEILVIVDEAGAGGAPVVSIESDPEAPATGWNTADVTVTLTASSDSDPTPAIEYRIGDGAWTAYTEPVVVTEDGEHVVTARATDAEGRISAERSQTVKIDATAPVTTKTLTETAGSVQLALAAADALSGVATVQYQVGGGFTATYAGEPVGITRLEEDQTVRFFATDVAGNVEADNTFVVAALEEEQPTWPVAPTRSFHSDGNPILGDGSYYSADASPLVADGKLIIHGGHDVSAPNSGTFTMNDYGAFVTDDVASGDWDLYQNNLDPDLVFSWATGNNAYAGQAVEGVDGRYYWYVPVQWKDTTPANRMAIGVAVSDSPVGPWVDHLGAPLVTWTDVFGTSTNGQEVIDPHVFVDDDDKVYLYWGSWNVARVQELGTDMKTKIGAISTMSGLTSFFEAPWVVKRNGIYHMVYDWKQGGSACTPSNYQACIGWATATNPKGPWTYKGIVLDAQSATTMHPSIIEFKDKWFITYHTKDAVGGGHFRRSIAIDEFTWTGDTINKITPTWADDPKFRLRTNVAPEGTAAASFTEQPPMRVAALNDGRQTTALLPPDQWGNYRGVTNTIESDWISYKWDSPVRVNSAGIQFHQDSNWIRPPQSWVMEYLDATGAWKPVPNPSGYPTAVNAWQNVTFDAVTTTSLRATFKGRPNGSYFHSVAVSEWEVNAVAPESVSTVSVITKPGVRPILPPAVRLTWPGGSSGWAPVNWRTIEVAQYAAEGTFTVQGRALGKADGYVTATVTVDEDGTTPPTDDTTAPTASVSFSGTQGAEGWFRSTVVARVAADDETSYLNTVQTKIGTAEWVSTPNVRFVDVPVVAQGETTVRGKATDAAGNNSTEVSGTVKIDTTLPTAAHTLDTATRTVTLTGTDAHSGVNGITYRFDGVGEWQTYAGTAIAAPDDLPHTLAYRVADKAGNVATGSVTVPMKPGAVLTGNVAKLGTPTTSFSTGWNSNAGLSDGVAGPLEVFPAAQADAKLGALQAGAWGTWPQVGEQWARISWGYDVTVDKVGVWWLSDSADTVNGGVIPPASWKLQYLAADGTTWVDVTPTDGTYSRARAVWNAVTFAPVTTKAVRVLAQSWGAASGGGSTGIHELQVIAAAATPPADTQAPILTVVKTPGTPAGANGWYTSAVTLTPAATDNVDAAPVIEADSGAGWAVVTGPLQLTDGSHSVQLRAKDAAGNLSPVQTHLVKVDTVKPTVSATVSGKNVTVTGVDAGSGIDRIEYQLGNGTWQAYTRVVNAPTAPRAVTVSFRAYDKAGHLSDVGSVRVLPN